MDLFRVKNFEEYQQFKRDRPPWIKFYCRTLRDPTIAELSLRARAVYFELLLLAAELKNSIPLSETYLRQSLMTQEPLKPLLSELFSHGFLIALHAESVSVSVSVSESDLKKQHEELLSNSVTTSKTKRKTSFPEDWSIEPWMRELCASLGLHAESEFADFKNHHLAKGTTFLSWPHAFRTWTANAVKFKKGPRNTDQLPYRPTKVVL